jgi:hypothetical protein
MLPTQEGRTLPVGTEVTVTDELATGLRSPRTRVILVAEGRYHVREEDLAYGCGKS